MKISLLVDISTIPVFMFSCS